MFPYLGMNYKVFRLSIRFNLFSFLWGYIYNIHYAWLFSGAERLDIIKLCFKKLSLKGTCWDVKNFVHRGYFFDLLFEYFKQWSWTTERFCLWNMISNKIMFTIWSDPWTPKGNVSTNGRSVAVNLRKFAFFVFLVFSSYFYCLSLCAVILRISLKRFIPNCS